jgi:aminopeptidase N
MSNAQQDDLWQELDAQARRDEKLPDNLNLKTIMDTWTLQKGYPVVHVTRTVAGKSMTLKLKQTRFQLDKKFANNNNNASSSSYQWYIPFTFTIRSRPDFEFEQMPFWMLPNATQEQQTLTLSYLDDVSRNWVIANIKHAGFYRVNYDAHNWQLLIDQLNSDFTLIDVVNRATLIDDAFNLAKVDYINQTTYLSLISYLQNETESLPFTLVTESLYFFDLMLSQNYLTFRKFKVYILILLTLLFRTLS